MAVIEAIETVYLEADAASVTFASLGSYEHLQLRCHVRTDRAFSVDRLRVRLNADTGTNYSNHRMYGQATTAAAAAETGHGAIDVYYIPAESEAATTYGGVILDILDYRNGSKNTTVQYSAGFVDPSDEEYMAFGSGLWDNVAAVTAIELAPDAGSNFVRGSEFTLFGLASS